MSKITIVHNSHSLSLLQRCERAYFYGHVKSIELAEPRIPFVKGALVSDLLSLYYLHKVNGTLTKSTPFDILDQILPKYEIPEVLESESEQVKEMIATRFLHYCKWYKHESWIPKRVEKIKCIDAPNNPGTGFSIVLYEDSHYRFIYEGEPDLIVQTSPVESRYQIVDHKTESRRSNLYFYNNQALGYCTALQTDIFTYNYFSLIKTGKPSDWFRRVSKIFSKEDLDSWKSTTIQWYFRTLACVATKEFPKSMQCDGKYGVCQYHTLCEQTNPEIIVRLEKMHYKKAERRTSW